MITNTIQPMLHFSAMQVGSTLNDPNLSNTTSIKNVNTSPLLPCHTTNNINIIPHSNQSQLLHQQHPLPYQYEGLQFSPYMHPSHRNSNPNNLNSYMLSSTPTISSQQNDQCYQNGLTKSGSGNLISMKSANIDVVKTTPVIRCVKTKPHANHQKIVKVPPHPNKFLSPPKCLRMKKMVSDDEFGSNYFELSWKSQKKKRIRKRKQVQSNSNSSESSQKLVIQFHQETPLENHKESNSSDSSAGSSFLCLSTLHQETLESELNNIQHNQQQIEKPEDYNCPWNALFPLKLVFDQ